MHSLRRETGRGTCLSEESEEGEVLEIGAGGRVAVRGEQVLSVGFVMSPFSATYCEDRVWAGFWI